MITYCPDCAHPVEYRVPDGDDRERAVCSNCSTVHYHNPRVITGTLPLWEGRVLLCRRDIEPRLGFWTLPAGFLELEETTEQGALRETWEEAKARVSIRHLLGLYNIRRVNQIYLIYLADLDRPDFAPTPESSEVKLFAFDEIPWTELAFRVIEHALRDYQALTGPAPGAHAPLFHRDI